MFDLLLDVVTAFASAGTEGLQDANHQVLYTATSMLAKSHAQPGCEAKIRGKAKALAFCLEHSLVLIEETGQTTGQASANIVCAVFGKDEGESEFAFTQQLVDAMIVRWSSIVRAVGLNSDVKPDSTRIFAAQLCVSDARKPLLLSNSAFVPYLVDSLLLDSEHPRANMKEDLRVWCQEHHATALAQLAVHADSRESLLLDGSVVPALQVVAKDGLSEAARETAAAALSALSDKQLVMVVDGHQKHVMLSCEFALGAALCSFLRMRTAKQCGRTSPSDYALTQINGMSKTSSRERICHSSLVATLLGLTLRT